VIEEHGCRLEYLPPYSPDYNPIEYSFSVIKRALKQQYQSVEGEDPIKFAEKIVDAAAASITPSIARNQFEHCGYNL
jgi:transposase